MHPLPLTQLRLRNEFILVRLGRTLLQLQDALIPSLDLQRHRLVLETLVLWGRIDDFGPQWT